MAQPTVEELRSVAEQHLPPEAADVWVEVLAPAVRLRHAGAGDAVVGRLGGSPRLGTHEWPSSDGGDLTHVLSVDCAAVAALLPVAGLPESGRLSFFHRVDAYAPFWESRGPWDPRGSTAQVRYVPDDDPAADMPAPDGVPTFPQTDLTAVVTVTWPSWDQPAVPNPRWGLPDDVVNAMNDDLTAITLAGGPEHQVGGYPVLIQDEVQRHFVLAELVHDSGVDVDEVDQYSAQFEALMGGWFLLAQIDTDVEASTMWGDSGLLYYGIRHADLRAGRFDRTRFVWHSA